MTESPQRTPQKFLNRYRLNGRLGTTRLATVFQAEDERLQRPVLIHVLNKELIGNAAAYQRFHELVETLSQGVDTCFPAIFERGEAQGRAFFVTEYVAGQALNTLTGTLSLDRALTYARALVRAYAACEAKGAMPPLLGTLHLIAADERHLKWMENWHRPADEIERDQAFYRAPELLVGDALTPQSIVYALGVIIFELLTGSRFAPNSDSALPPVSTIRPAIHMPQLDSVLAQATDPDPQRRFASVQELDQAMHGILEGRDAPTRKLAVPGFLRPRPPAAPASPAPPVPTQALDMAEPIPASGETQYGRLSGLTGRFRNAAFDTIRRIRNVDTIQRAAMKVNRQGLIAIGLLLLVVFGLSVFAAQALVDRLFAQQLPPIPAFQVPMPTFVLPNIEQTTPLIGIKPGSASEASLIVTIPDGLNMRDQPSLQGHVLAVLPQGLRVFQRGPPQSGDTIIWLPVRAELDGRALEGWVSLEHVQPER